jgi:deoxyadenosine kinase
MSSKLLIGVSGIIGVGKSTLTDSLGGHMDLKIFQEPVKTNEYLGKFYQDMNRYAFPMQVYLLNHRFRQYQQMIWENKNCIQDRTIYEDVIFARLLNRSGIINDLDFKTYMQLFENMTSFIRHPDIVVFLDVEPEKAMERINKRGRECEKDISLEYLVTLRDGYEEWLKDIEGKVPIIRLDWNTYQDTEKVAELIKKKLSM